MAKTALLLKIKQKVLYHDKKAVGILLAVWVAMVWLFVSALYIEEEKVRVFLDDQDQSGLAQGFLETAGEKIQVEPKETGAALSEIKRYQAELLLVIPVGAKERLLAGETDGIFQLYYLKDNDLALLLADRLISSALAEVYLLQGEYLAGELYQKYALPQSKPDDLLAEFRRKVTAMRGKMQPGYYFSIFTELPPEKRPDKAENRQTASSVENEPENLSDSKEQRNSQTEYRANPAIRAWVVLLIAGGVNFVFLLYFGLKLLYLRDKNDKMKVAGFTFWHQLLSDMGVLLLPEALLVAALLPAAYGLSGLALWRGLVLLVAAAVGFNLLLIRLVKEKQMYFPVGIGFYILTVLIGIAIFL